MFSSLWTGSVLFWTLTYFNTLAMTYWISRTLSLLSSRDIHVNSYHVPDTTVDNGAQRPHKLWCRVLAMYIGAALYRIRATVIYWTAFNMITSSEITTLKILINLSKCSITVHRNSPDWGLKIYTVASFFASKFHEHRYAGKFTSLQLFKEYPTVVRFKTQFSLPMKY